jgi:hypothetical protein
MKMLTLESFELIALIGLAVILVIVYSLAFRLIEMRTRMGPQLDRVDAKLDLLLKQANIKFDPYANIPSDAAAAADSKRRKILLKSSSDPSNDTYALQEGILGGRLQSLSEHGRNLIGSGVHLP